MLQNRMLLQPHGNKVDIDIGTVFIALNSVNAYGEGNYSYYIRVPKSQFNMEEHVHGKITNHDRNQNAFHLLRKILNDWGATGDAESEEFMERVNGLAEYN